MIIPVEVLERLADECIQEYFSHAKGTAVVVRPGKWLGKRLGPKANGKVRLFTSMIIAKYSELGVNGKRYKLTRIMKNPLRLYYALDNGDLK